MNRRKADRIPGISGYKGLLTVRCQVNEKYQGRFLVDTGATLTVISQRFAQEMKLDITQPIRQVQIASAHQVAQTPVVRLDSLQVGDKKSQQSGGINCCVTSRVTCRWLIGSEFFRKIPCHF
jgi:predicted aspartyl protease